MWSPRITTEAAEKIRKAQWTKENTAKTQAIVDRLEHIRKCMKDVSGESNAQVTIKDAIKRFAQMDKGVKVPE